MFGLGKRDDRVVEAVREEMTAADTRARTVLANAMAQIESRLSNDHEESARLQASTQAAIENLRYEVASRPADIGPVLEQVAAMCALVAERLEADRLERKALTEAITLLARPALAGERSNVLGGTVLAPSEISLADDAGASEPTPGEAIDLPAIDARIVEEPVPVERVGAPAVIDLNAEERHPAGLDPAEAASGTEIWNAFEQSHAEAPGATDELDLRPRQGTRLTAARRSNAGAAWR